MTRRAGTIRHPQNQSRNFVPGDHSGWEHRCNDRPLVGLSGHVAEADTPHSDSIARGPWNVDRTYPELRAHRTTTRWQLCPACGTTGAGEVGLGAEAVGSNHTPLHYRNRPGRRRSQKRPAVVGHVHLAQVTVAPGSASDRACTSHARENVRLVLRAHLRDQHVAAKVSQRSDVKFTPLALLHFVSSTTGMAEEKPGRPRPYLTDDSEELEPTVDAKNRARLSSTVT